MTAARPGRTRPVRPGISLIEVLLATAIFLISIAALGILVRSGSDFAVEASRTNTCSQLARSKMAELESGTGDVTLDSGGTGTFSDRPNYNWEVISVPTTAGGGTVYDVTVRVWIETGSRPTEVSLSQLILDPYLQDNAAPRTAPTTETPP